MTKLEYLLKANGYMELCDFTNFQMFGKTTEENTVCLIFWKEDKQFSMSCQDNQKNYIPVIINDDLMELMKEIKIDYEEKRKEIQKKIKEMTPKDCAMNIAQANMIYKNMRDYKGEEDVNGKGN